MTSVITASLPRFQTPTDVLLRDVSGASRSWTASAWATGIVAFVAGERRQLTPECSVRGGSSWPQFAGRDEIGQWVRLGRHEPGDDRSSLRNVDLLTALGPGQHPGGVLVGLPNGDYMR